MAKKKRKTSPRRRGRYQPSSTRQAAAYRFALYSAATARTANATLTGPAAVKVFFDEVENNEGLQGAIAKIHSNIIDLAKEFGLYFTYEDMSEHLKERWDIRLLPMHYCCC